MRLRIVALFIVFFGAFFAVYAIDKRDDRLSSNGRLFPQIYYFQLNSTNSVDINNRNNYALVKPGDGETECGEGPYVCTILDIPYIFNTDKPALSLGNVTDNAIGYSLTESVGFEN